MVEAAETTVGVAHICQLAQQFDLKINLTKKKKQDDHNKPEP